jgi:hypothetical protein
MPSFEISGDFTRNIPPKSRGLQIEKTAIEEPIRKNRVIAFFSDS